MEPQEYLQKHPRGAPQPEWPQCLITHRDWPGIVQWANRHGVTWSGGNTLYLSSPPYPESRLGMLFLWQQPLPGLKPRFVLSYQGADGLQSTADLRGWRPQGSEYVSQGHPDGMGPCNFRELLELRPQIRQMDF